MAGRQGLIVWLKTTHRVRLLQRFGYVYYINKRRNYAVLYTDKALADQTKKQLETLKFVKKVTFSPRQTLNMDFSTALDGEAERAKRMITDNDFHYPPQ